VGLRLEPRGGLAAIRGKAPKDSGKQHATVRGPLNPRRGGGGEGNYYVGTIRGLTEYKVGLKNMLGRKVEKFH